MKDKKKKVSTYIAGFILLAVFVFLFDRALYYIIFHMESDFYSKNKFEQRFESYMTNRSYNVLILGTSRSYEGLHPCYFNETPGIKAFKETYRGKGPKYHYYFYKLFKKYAGTPKMVVIGVDYFGFNINSDPQWMARFKEEAPKETFSPFTAPLLLVHHKKKIDNFHNNIMIRLKQKHDPDADKDSFKDIIDIQKYRGIDKPVKELVTKRPARFPRQDYIPYPGVEGKYFTKLLEELDKDKVTVILVGLPDYIGSYRTNYQRIMFLKELKGLIRDFKNTHIFNYNKVREFPLHNTNYFNDGGYGQTNSHLSQKGAEHLNRLLIKDIKKHF